MSDPNGDTDGDNERNIRAWLQDHRQQVVVTVVVVGAIAAPVAGDAAVSLILGVQTSGDISYQNDAGFTIVEADPDADRINSSVLFNESDQSAIRFATDAGNVTFRANGSGSGRIDTLASRTTVSNLNVSQTALEIDPADEQPIRVSGGTQSVELRNTTLTDEQVDLTLSTNGQSTLSVPVANETGIFAVKSSTGEILDRDVSTDGTADLTIPDGTHDIRLRRGGTVTVFNETNATAGPLSGQNLSLTVSVFSDDRVVSSGDVSDGRFALAGVDGGRGPFLITVTNDGFVSRTIIVEDLFTNTSVFLLPDSEQRVETRFILEDNTGQFASEGSLIFVDKIINGTDDETRYRTVRSGPASPNGELTSILDQGETYRVRVADGDGSSRVLGTYQAKSAQSVTLSIGQIQFQLSNESTFKIGAERTSPDVLQFRIESGSNQLDTISVTIHELGDPSNTLQSTTQFDQDNLTITETLSASEQNLTWVANYSVASGGEEVSGQIRFGGGRGSESVQIPLDQEWKERFALGGILLVGTLFSAGNLRAGAIVVPGLGGLLWLLGWLPPVTGAVSVGVSMTLGVIYAVGVRGGA